MTGLEHRIWAEFLTHHELKFNWLMYEPAIVTVKPTSEKPIVYGADSWDESCALRADVIFQSQGKITLVEVEERVSYTGIGQLLCYSASWNQLNPNLPVSELLLIALYSDERLAAALELFGINLALVNELPGFPNSGQTAAAQATVAVPGESTAGAKRPGSEPPITIKQDPHAL